MAEFVVTLVRRTVERAQVVIEAPDESTAWERAEECADDADLEWEDGGDGHAVDVEVVDVQPNLPSEDK